MGHPLGVSPLERCFWAIYNSVNCTVVPPYLQGTGSSTPPQDAKTHEWLSPLHKMAQNNAYNWPSTFVESQSQIENTVFDPRLFESMDTKPADTEGQLYLYLGVIVTEIKLFVCFWFTKKGNTFLMVSESLYTLRTHSDPSTSEYDYLQRGTLKKWLR